MGNWQKAKSKCKGSETKSRTLHPEQTLANCPLPIGTLPIAIKTLKNHHPIGPQAAPRLYLFAD
jgi:hypothetical protein